MKKARYRIENWQEYNNALANRGSLTFWFDEEAMAAWQETERPGRRGAPRRYTAMAIQCGLTLREVFCLSLRATEGLVRSVLELMGLPLPTPDYTTLCRRQSGLEVDSLRRRTPRAVHVVIDATGLKVSGDGEWQVRTRGDDTAPLA